MNAFPETVFLCCDHNIWSRDKRTVLKRGFHRLSNKVLNNKIHCHPNFGVRTYGIFKKVDLKSPLIFVDGDLKIIF